MTKLFGKNILQIAICQTQNGRVTGKYHLKRFLELLIAISPNSKLELSSASKLNSNIINVVHSLIE